MHNKKRPLGKQGEVERKQEDFVYTSMPTRKELNN